MWQAHKNISLQTFLLQLTCKTGVNVGQDAHVNATLTKNLLVNHPAVVILAKCKLN